MVVVVRASVRSVAERIEHNPPRLRFGPNQIEHRLHRRPSPFRHPRPSLDAEVLGDLLVVRERVDLLYGQLDGVLHEAVDAKPILGETRVEDLPVFVGPRVRAVVPEVRRDVLFRILPGLRIDVLEQSLDGTDQREAEPLHRSRTSKRDGGRASQATATITIDAANTTKPTHEPE